MMKRSVLFAATLAVLAVAGSAKADYQLSLTNLSPPSVGTSPGTTFTFTIPAATQNGVDNIASNFNVINVANPTVQNGSTGSTPLSVNFTIVGTNGTTGSVSGTLSGTFSFSSGDSSFAGAFTNVTGSGFTLSNISYTAPSPLSQNGSMSSGNISFRIAPTGTAVPEPASVAMLGMGLVGAGFTAYRRSRAK